MKRLSPSVTICLPVPSWATVMVSSSEVLYVTLNADVFDFATSDEKSLAPPLLAVVVVVPAPEDSDLLLLPQAATASVAATTPITSLYITASGGRARTASVLD